MPVAAQVDVAVAQADGLVGVDAGRRPGTAAARPSTSTSTVQSPTSTSPVARLGVDGALGPGPHGAGDPHDVLVAQVGGAVDHALHHAGAVAHVDEGQVLAVLAPAGDPAAQRRPVCPACAAPQLAAPVRAQPGMPVAVTVVSLGGHRSSSRRWSTTFVGRARRPACARRRGGRAPRRCRRPPPARPRSGRTRAPERSAAFIWAFIDRPSKARSARSPARRSSAVRSRAASPPVTSTTNTSSVDAGRGEHALGVAGQQHPLDARAEADARASAARPAPRPGRRSAAAERWSTARRRAPRSGTRRWCACSSRGRGPGGARAGRRCRARRGRWTRSKWARGRRRRGRRRCVGASADHGLGGGALAVEHPHAGACRPSAGPRRPGRPTLGEPGPQARRRSARGPRGVPIELTSSSTPAQPEAGEVVVRRAR